MRTYEDYMQTLPQDLWRDLKAFFAKREVSAWLVGGTVRDLLLGRASSDIDLAVAGDGFALARAFANAHGAAFVALDSERRTGRVIFGVGKPVPADESGSDASDTAAPPAGRIYLDIASLRGATIEQDLRARDVTINALALPLQQAEQSTIDRAALVDPCGGLADLDSRIVRACSDDSLRDDPLRMLRALRLAATLELSISDDLDALLRRDAPLVMRPAAERIRDELMRLLAVPHASPWLRYMDDLGILTRLFPELEASRACDQLNVYYPNVLVHMLETVAAVDWMLEELYADEGQSAVGSGQSAGEDTRHETQDARQETGDTQPTIDHQPLTTDSHSSLITHRSSLSSWLPEAVQTHPEMRLELAFGDELRAHFAEQVGGVSRVALFKLAALLHDNAKPQTRQVKPDGGISFYDHQVIGADVAKRIGQRLRLPKAAVGYICGVVRAHMRPGQLGTQPVTLRAVLRLFRDTGGTRPNSGAHGPDVLLHAMADHIATRGPGISVDDWRNQNAWTNALLEVYWGQPLTPPSPLLTGKDIMEALNLSPGERVGTLLHEVREAQAAGEITTREQALKLVQQVNEGLTA